MDIANEFNFVHEETSDWFIDRLLEPEEGEHLQSFGDSWNMANIVVECGLFPSYMKAIKNGFDRPIPKGYSEHIFRKGKPNQIKVWILNIREK